MKALHKSLLLLLFIALVSCESKVKFNADFNLLTKNEKGDYLELVTQNAQEISSKKGESIKKIGLDYTVDQDDLLLNVEEKFGSLRVSTLALGLPDSWKPYSEIEFELSNENDEPTNAKVTLWAARGRMIDSLVLKANQTAKITFDLFDIPLIGSPKEKYKVRQIEFHFDNEEGSEVRVKSVALVEADENRSFVVVDQFGQRKSTTWEGKMKSENEFKERHDAEMNSLQNQFGEETHDQYLGVKTGETFKTNGYFSVDSKMIDGKERWFFVSPEGNPFWSFGVTGIRPKKPMHSVTQIEGNEQLFEYLPDRNGKFASAYIDTTLSFYNVNIFRKYGNVQGWRDMSIKRLKSWGLNTIGNWAEDSLIYTSKFPFTYSFETEIKQWDQDVYHPDWESYVDSVFAKASMFKEDKYLLGYFVDNEAGWGHLRLLQKLPENAFLRKVWVDELKSKYSSLQAFNKKSEAAFATWDAVMSSSKADSIAEEDIILLEELFAHKYFKTITQTLEKYDQNHLYLGCRFTRKIKPAHLLKVAGKYCDVVTVNVYSYEPIKKDMDEWYALTGRPMLIGEHQGALNSPRQLPLRWRIFTEEERYEYFVNYVSKWAHIPYSLGSHWYQYADQHITGRASNGENQTIGFVDITDTPYQRMVDAARYNAKNIDHWTGIKKSEAQ